MGEALAEAGIDKSITKKLEELSRQMEEVNTKEQDLQIDLEEQEILDEEVSLNVEEPTDPSSLDSLAQDSEEQELEGDTASEAHEPPGEPTSEPEDQKETEAAEEVSSEDVSGQELGEDELGISVEDDELWEEEEAEEIPLFEEELLSEISQEEEKEQTSQDQGIETAEDAPAAEDDSVQTAGQGQTEAENQEPGPEDSEEKQTAEGSQPQEAPPAEAPSLLARIVPWVITGISSCLLFLGIFTFWMLWKGPVTSESAQNPQTQQVQGQATSPKPKSATKPIAKKRLNETSSGYEAIDLAPFIIPGKSGGELVFFKLQVELVVPDATTKQELVRRQAWLRDIIYQELKGLDISSGIKGDILERYRIPLLKRLNKEFAPLKIEDIRLMGYLLR